MHVQICDRLQPNGQFGDSIIHAASFDTSSNVGSFGIAPLPNDMPSPMHRFDRPADSTLHRPRTCVTSFYSVLDQTTDGALGGGR